MTADLSTQYMGLQLPHPIVAAACPLTGELDMLRRLEDAGVAAVVLPSLFEEQIEHDEMENHRFRETHANAFAEAMTFFPDMDEYNSGLDKYLDHIRAAKSAVSTPVIASLNGSTPGGWVRYATQLQEAGADALELNVYLVANDVHQTADDTERHYVELVQSVKEAISIPLSVKIGPYFSSLPNISARLFAAGANGLAIFNRYLYPDIDLDTLEFTTELTLTTSDDLRMPLRWIGILRGELPDASLAATSGVNTTTDIVKLLLVGADITMIAAVLYKQGPEVVTDLISGLQSWLDEREYKSVRQMKGSMCAGFAAYREAYNRANYMEMLVNFTAPDAV
ncbi:MAG: dihydroorotate dehydrogenase-like protein [Planctomycetaceae bacterium]